MLQKQSTHLWEKTCMRKYKNIMTVDLEDYYCDLDFDKWKNYQSRIIETTETLLKLFEKYTVTATFFTVGHIAKEFPELIEKIVSKGHEIGSHSYSHIDIRKSTKEKFENDLIRSIKTLEKISGERVLGFRAPYFSIDQKHDWAYRIIRRYLKYDSSIFPVKTPLYGIPNAPRYPYNPSNHNFLKHDSHETFLELPPATYHLPLFGNIPIAGGFYLRFLPYWLIKSGIKKINKDDQPAIFYIHPKDLDSNMPVIAEYTWHYYYGLKSSLRKFEKLLSDFRFDSVRTVMTL